MNPCGLNFPVDAHHPKDLIIVYDSRKVCMDTVGHHNSTMSENVYLDLVTRGLLWTAGKLQDDGTPVKGMEAQ